MHPDQGRWCAGFLVKPQPLRQMLPVAGLLASAPPQAAESKRQRKPPCGGIKKTHQISVRPVNRVRIASGLASGSYWRATGRWKVCSIMYWPDITACEAWSEKHTQTEPGGNGIVTCAACCWYCRSDFMPSCSC